MHAIELPARPGSEKSPHTSWTILVSDRIHFLAPSLTTEVSNVQIAAGHYGPQLRITTLTRRAVPAEQVHIIEIGVKFGHGLVREVDSAGQDLDEIEELVRRLIFDGFEESVRVRRGKVVRSEVTMPIAGRPRRISTRGPLPLWGSTRDQIKHPPWNQEMDA
jgi:hypothetical protein